MALKKAVGVLIIMFALLMMVATVFAQDSGNYITNGTFSAVTGNLPNGWAVFGAPLASSIQYRTQSGVFEFYRQVGSSQAVVLQDTGVALPQFARLEVSIDIGNSSNVRKRITIIVHDEDFSDLQVCTFWIAQNSTLQTRVMRTYTTEAWTSAFLSIYASSDDGVGYARIDNVVMRQRPTMPLVGTECYEPGATLPSELGAFTDEELQLMLPTLVPTAVPYVPSFGGEYAPAEMPVFATPEPLEPSSSAEGSTSEGSMGE
jgi:hypothetical protein